MVGDKSEKKQSQGYSLNKGGGVNMITTNNGATQINGNMVEILADLSVIIRSVYESVDEATHDKDFAMDVIVQAGRVAFAEDESVKMK